MRQPANEYAPPRRRYGEGGLVPEEPAWRALPERAFSPEFLGLRERAFSWLEPYYDREHLTRASDWMLVLAPDAPEHLVMAALMHDLERSVPGGPVLDMAADPWDDRAYNDAHTARSAVIVARWLEDEGARPELVAAVGQPIREHEFGGSPEGDLMQSADSISFLETNSPLVAGWAIDGRCSIDKAREKLTWMGGRVRLERGRTIASAYLQRCLEEFNQRTESKETAR